MSHKNRGVSRVWDSSHTSIAKPHTVPDTSINAKVLVKKQGRGQQIDIESIPGELNHTKGNSSISKLPSSVEGTANREYVKMLTPSKPIDYSPKDILNPTRTNIGINNPTKSQTVNVARNSKTLEARNSSVVVHNTGMSKLPSNPEPVGNVIKNTSADADIRVAGTIPRNTLPLADSISFKMLQSNKGSQWGSGGIPFTRTN